MVVVMQNLVLRIVGHSFPPWRRAFHYGYAAIWIHNFAVKQIFPKSRGKFLSVTISVQRTVQIPAAVPKDGLECIKPVNMLRQWPAF